MDHADKLLRHMPTGPASYDFAPAKPNRYIRHRMVSWNLAPELRPPLWATSFVDALRADHVWFRHVNYPAMALEFVKSGAFEFRSEGVVSRVVDGDVYLILRGSNARLEPVGPGCNHKLTLMLQGTALDTFCEMLNFRGDRRIVPADPAGVERVMRRIGRLLRRRTPGDEISISAALYTLLLELAGETRREELLPEALVKAADCARRRFGEKLSIPELAEAAGVSVPTLTRQFRRYFGVSPHAWVSELRLRRAAELLRTRRVMVKDVAQRCGFAEARAFATKFRAKFGCTPAAYRGVLSESNCME